MMSQIHKMNVNIKMYIYERQKKKPVKFGMNMREL